MTDYLESGVRNKTNRLIEGSDSRFGASLADRPSTELEGGDESSNLGIDRDKVGSVVSLVDEPASGRQANAVIGQKRTDLSGELTKTKQRVADHGEVFTPEWLVEAMLNLVKDETERIDSRFLEPACGSGNFLVKILQRKLAAVQAKYAKSEFERQNYALLAVMCTYGIELLHDNIAECRQNLVKVFAEYLEIDTCDDFFRAARHVLSVNLVHGDAMKMTTLEGAPITFAEWGYLGKGKFQRRDFRFDALTLSSAFSAEDSLFASLGRQEIFVPDRTYEPMTVVDLANRGTT